MLTFAVDCNCAFRSLADIKELFHNAVTRRASVNEKQISMVEAIIYETLGVVDLLVETNDRGDIVLAEVRKI